MPTTLRQHLEHLVPAGDARVYARSERKRVFILFTPRSGSSWLGDLLLSTRVFGEPDEYLNQDTNQEVVRRFATRTEHDYLHAVEEFTASNNGVFSIEAVWGHLERTEIDLLNFYKDAHFIYLRRRDILAQAISLLLATRTGMFHDPSGTAHGAQEAHARQKLVPEESFADIRRWWGHLMNYECAAQVQFLLRGITPLRLFYEDLLDDPLVVVTRVRRFCDIPETIGGPPSSSHVPVRGALNAELARAFLAANQDFADAMNAFRPPIVY